MSNLLLKKLLFLFFTAFLLGVSGWAHSALYTTVTGYYKTMVNNYMYYYWVNGTYVWGPEGSPGDVICQRAGGCTVGICMWDLKGRPVTNNPFDSYTCSGYGESSTKNSSITIPNGATVSDAQIKWAAEKGSSGGFRIYAGIFYNSQPFSIAGNACMGLLVWPSVNQMADSGGKLISGQACGILPPNDLQCTTSGKVDIDYGTLEASKLNGATATTTFSLTCDRDATATIKLNDSVIDLGRNGDLTAAISIGGKDLATGSDVAVTNGTVTTTITSTLKAKGTPAAGPFEGSSVLIISYQ
jgi:hypothetical protein